MTAATATYPPEPWHLGGSMLMTAWRIPTAEMRAVLGDRMPDGVVPVVRGAHAFVITAFVRYEPGGVLSYDELLLAVVARRGRQLITTIPRIWVDSPASLAGGRTLWGIPKHLADFEQTWDGPITARAALDGDEIASARAVPRLSVPGWRRLPLPTAQRLDGRTTFAEVQALGRLRFASSDWAFAPDGPLGFLGRGRQLGTAVLRDMTIRFGPSVQTVDADPR